MKQLMYLIVVLILLAFAVPAIAADHVNKDGPAFGNIMAPGSDTVYQPVMANQEIKSLSPFAATDEITYLVSVATLKRNSEVESNARDVGEWHLGNSAKIGDEEGTDYRGGVLLRQGGEPLAKLI